MVRIETARRILNIIEVYAPTVDNNGDEIEHFYDELQQTLDIIKSRDVTITMGAFNANIGKG